MTKKQVLLVTYLTLCVFGLALVGFYVLKFSLPSRRPRKNL